MVTLCIAWGLLLYSCGKEEQPEPQPEQQEEQQDPPEPVNPPEPPEPQQPEYPVPTLGTGLRSVYIDTPTGIYSKDIWVEGGTIQIVDDGGKLWFSDSLSIKGRGNSTWSYAKKPYTFKLSHKADLLGKGESKRYVLLANWMDRTLLRNDVAFELARRTSIDWTPEGEFVELYLNGVHKGNYWLGEQIKVEKTRIRADYLIELDTYWDATWKFYSQYGYKPNTWNYGLPMNVKYPEDEDFSQEGLDRLQGMVWNLENTIYNGGDYSSMIDFDSFIDWYLVHELTYNLEPNHPKSCYIHFRNGVLFAGPVWDFDWYTFQPNTSGWAIHNSIYFGELFKNAAFTARVKERWAELKPLFEDVDNYIEQISERISASESINHQMWPCTSEVNRDQNLTFSGAVNRLRKALSDRIAELDRQVNKL